MEYCEINTKYDKRVVRVIYKMDAVDPLADSVLMTICIPELGEIQQVRKRLAVIQTR